MQFRLLIVSVFGALYFTARSQYEPDTLPPLPLVCDVFLLAGSQLESPYAVGLGQWRQLAPDSELLARDLNDHTFGRPNYRRDVAFSTAMTMSVSLRLGGAGRNRRSGGYLRAGFTYKQFMGNDLRLQKETRLRFDTLVSSQTGQTIFIDSVSVSRYELDHLSRQLALEASLIFLKEYPKRWALYGGGGVQIGFAFDGRSRIAHFIERSVDPQTFSSYSQEGLATEQEEFRTKDDLVVAVYAPLGISYRLSKKRAFWQAINLCYEMRPTLSFGGVPELGLGARVAVGHYFGLRLDLMK